ncbi:sugar phosphate nucleotidyltransferase [Castellaniella sp.]|uniref:sugar phosphate nucleotidyltransferase n=1 Tax=Castellaniella sp. TaxID=1955812 RepID=UPI002AFE4AA8|nr:sugar phosphate nucleotidyltransferase [Castellaniella sp.]
MQAYILCGGSGTRLQSVLKGGQKALVDVQGRPFLALVLEQLHQAGVDRAILCAHYRADQLAGTLPSLAESSEVSLELVVEPQPMGTGGALLFALSKTSPDQRYLVLNADTFLPARAYGALAAHNREGVVLVTRVADCGRYGGLELDGDGLVLALHEKNRVGPGLVSAGAYCFSHAVWSDHVVRACSMERDLLPGLIRRKQLFAHTHEGTFIDIGIPEALDQFKQMIVSGEAL